MAWPAREVRITTLVATDLVGRGRPVFGVPAFGVFPGISAFSGFGALI
jgi:hypothetical protein